MLYSFSFSSSSLFSRILVMPRENQHKGIKIVAFFSFFGHTCGYLLLEIVVSMISAHHSFNKKKECRCYICLTSYIFGELLKLLNFPVFVGCFNALHFDF